MLGAEWNWHWHIQKIREKSDLFNGKIAIGVTVSQYTSSIDDVKELFNGVPVSDWVVTENNNLAETLTFNKLLETIKNEDQNTVTLRGHSKGVTHKEGGFEQEWASLMWDTCLDWLSVEDALKSHSFAGPMKCHEPLFARQRYKWFYAGSFYWFRNSDVFSRDWRYESDKRWHSEEWPGLICSESEAACLCHDFASQRSFGPDYWRNHVVPDFYQWKTARGESANSDLHKRQKQIDDNKDSV
jgi:hypothetical protein